MKAFAVLSLTLFVGLALAEKTSPVYPGSSSNVASKSVAAAAKEDTTSAKVAQSKSDSYSSPVAAAGGSSYASPVAAQSTPGTQGYYYYYYPVGSNGNAGAASNAAPYTVDEESSGLLGGLLAGKGALIAVVVGALVLLAIAGTTISFTGRSLTDITDYAYNNFDDLTTLVLQGIEFYESLQ